MNLFKANRIWQRSTGVLAVLIIAYLIVWLCLDPKVYLFQWLLWLHLPLLMLHEFEEYIFPGGFKEFLNTKTVLALSQPESDVPLGNPMVFFINMGAWILIVIGALLANTAPWFGVMMVVFELINIIGHGGLFQIRHRGYNPGLITAIFLFLPYVVTVFWVAISNNILSPDEYILSAIGGIALALSLPAWAKFNTRRFNQRRRA
ncbi:MAG: HXXEE domain-containing protein [Candidatus Ancaeobacter aquaticus]|nr:HXXEE domain-containing protein [Candidatus Ancaeobacter aquaticus]